MKKREKVTKIMSTKLMTINLNEGTPELAKVIMEENHIRHLPVVSGDKLMGIISLTDIHRISYGANYGQEEAVDTAIFDALSLANVMVHNPNTISPDTTIREAAEILGREEFHALPVVADDKLIGIMTSTDLINYLLEQY